MIGEWGIFALILSFCFALCQGTLTWWSVQRRHAAGMILARYTSVAQLLFTGLAFCLLGAAFLADDWSLRYVATNANAAIPWVYRLCAVWGAHEGSMLLWVFILTGWMSAVALKGRRLPLAIQARVLAVLALVAVGFDLFILSTSNPFLRLFGMIPAHGIGLNPLLQDPGLVSHPPMLYLGYVGFSVAFAFAITGLLTGRMDASWARWARPWTLAAWAFLTIGIVLGSWWAYRELGWGGWWFWDPVENASFLPWLAGTALIHSLKITQRKGLCKAWTVLLAVTAFSLSLLGTFLVRSGVLISVHAFAVDPERGSFILVFLCVVIGFSLLLYALRSKQLARHGLIEPASREGLLLVNNLLLFTGLLTVLLGTLYPLLMDVLGLNKISVGAPYFNTIFVPLMWPLVIVMGFAPFLQWEGNALRGLRRSLWAVLVFCLVAAALLLWILTAHFSVAVWLGLSAILWLAMTTLLGLFFPRVKRGSLQVFVNKLPMTIAHLGFAVCVVGILLTTAYSRTSLLSMHSGERAELAPYSIYLDSIGPVQGQNYTEQQARIILFAGAKQLSILKPSQRRYPQAGMVIAKTDIFITPWRDLYVALGAQQPDGRWGVRLYDKPFVRWIWWGGLLMAAGALLAAVKRRRAG